jgi:hypothetical protein
MYTASAIRHFMRLAGIEEVADQERAEAIWCSICDPDELPVLRRARQMAAGRPVIMGGFEAYFPYPYLAWADYIVMGAAEGFVEAYGRDPRDALALDNVVSRLRPTGEPDYRIRYDRYPLVRMAGGNRYYYMGSRGCHRKCRFCATSWTQPYSRNSDRAIRAAVRQVERQPRGKLTLIGNDSRNLISSPAVAAQSVTVEDYLRDPERYRSRMLHFGIEGWTEEERRRLGKPIPDDHLRELLRVTKRLRQRCELFYIVFPDWGEERLAHLYDLLPWDVELAPQIYLKMTYFDACPHTPLADQAISPVYCDTQGMFYRLNARCKRIRIFPTRSMARSAWRTCLRRATSEEAERLGVQPTDVNRPESFDLFRARLRQLDLEPLLGRHVDWSGIHVSTS